MAPQRPGPTRRRTDRRPKVRKRRSVSSIVERWRQIRDHKKASTDNASSDTSSAKPVPAAILHPPDQYPCALAASDFYIGTKLGQGSSASVYLARHLDTDFICALKIISKAQWAQEHTRVAVCQEIDIHHNLAHKNIVKLLSWFQDDGNIYLVLEHTPGGDLHAHLEQQRLRQPHLQKHSLQQQHQRKGGFDEATAAQYTVQVVEALRYMHNMKLIHRDIKPGNILLDSHGNVKLADFGLFELCTSGFSSRKCGTVDYLSPEVASAYLSPDNWDDLYVGAIDQWNLGVLIYELLVDELPFVQGDDQETLERIAGYGDEGFKLPRHVSKHAEDLMRRLMVKDPKQRMGFDEVLRHPWIIWHIYKSIPRVKRLPNYTKEHGV